VPNTQSKEVNLTKRVQTGKGMRYCPVVLAANGRVKPDLVIINGQRERHPEGAYYLEWRERGKRVRLSVGKDATDASSRRQRKEAELNALNNGVAVVPDNGDNGHRSLAAAVAEFLDETKLTKKPKTLAAYTTALNYFTESCPKLYVHDIERRDMLKFSAFLRDEKNQAPRSVYNKFENVMSFLKANGIRGLVGKNDWPRYTEEEPEIYEQAELDKLFKACDGQEEKDIQPLNTDADILEKQRSAAQDNYLAYQKSNSPLAHRYEAAMDEAKARIDTVRNTIRGKDRDVQERMLRVKELNEDQQLITDRLKDPGRLRPRVGFDAFATGLVNHVVAFILLSLAMAIVVTAIDRAALSAFFENVFDGF